MLGRQLLLLLLGVGVVQCMLLLLLLGYDVALFAAAPGLNPC
jgi:hypothetical protein